MPVTVKYPGVYIEEFAPGAPIQGVGTSTAAFIGTAAKGPTRKPTLIQSWDAFQTTFGGFIPKTEDHTSYLAPAVYGFFLNGGTACYVVRISAGKPATATLKGSDDHTEVLVISAREEGKEGESVSVAVSYPTEVETLKAYRTEMDIRSISLDVPTDCSKLAVDDASGFVANDRVLLTKSDGSTPKDATVTDVAIATNTLLLSTKVTKDYEGGKVRTANLSASQRRIRLEVQGGKPLSQTIPPGSALRIENSDHTEYHTVMSSIGDSVLLADGLANEFDLANTAKLPTVTPLEFTVVISRPDPNKKEESFKGRGMNAKHPRFCGAISSEQVLFEVKSLPTSGSMDPRPKEGSYKLGGGVADNRKAAWDNLSAEAKALLDLLEPHDDVAIVCIPGAPDAQRAIVDHCDSMKDRFAILDSEPCADGTTIRDATDKVLTQFEKVRSEVGYAALYFPWIRVRNPATGDDELWPPSGHIAGAFARTDAEKGVHKAPANTNLRGALGLQLRLTDANQGDLNLTGINVLRVFPGQAQPLIWGARTTATDRNWQYVNIRRLFMFLEESIAEGIRWAVFEPNNLQLWQKVKRSITEFLTRVWRADALFGATPEQAFYVRIDEALNSFDDQRNGRLNIEIGVRPTYAAEFIVVRIGIWDGGSQVSAG